MNESNDIFRQSHPFNFINSLSLLTDEDFNGDILRGVVRRKPDADIVRVQDVGLQGANDTEVLLWAATQNRLLLTHDVATMTQAAYTLIEQNTLLPGVIMVRQSVPLGVAIDEIVLMLECGVHADWANQVKFLPLK